MAWTSPTMLSANTPSPYVVSDYYNYGSGYEGWRMFTYSYSSFYTSYGGPDPNGKRIITMDTGSYAPGLTGCSIRSYPGNGVKNFKIQGSNDNANWSDVYTGYMPSGDATLNNFSWAMAANYRYIALYCIDNWGVAAMYQLNYAGEIMVDPQNYLHARGRDRLWNKTYSLGASL